MGLQFTDINFTAFTGGGHVLVKEFKKNLITNMVG